MLPQPWRLLLLRAPSKFKKVAKNKREPWQARSDDVESRVAAAPLWLLLLNFLSHHHHHKPLLNNQSVHKRMDLGTAKGVDYVRPTFPCELALIGVALVDKRQPPEVDCLRDKVNKSPWSSPLYWSLPL